MVTITFSAGAIFTLGIITGIVFSLIGLVAVAVANNRKSK